MGTKGFRWTKRKVVGLLLVPPAVGVVFLLTSLGSSGSQDDKEIRDVIHHALVLEQTLAVPPSSYTGTMNESIVRDMQRRTVEQLGVYMTGEPLARMTTALNRGIEGRKSGPGGYLGGGVNSIEFSQVNLLNGSSAVVRARVDVWAKVGQEQGGKLVIATPRNLMDFTYSLTKIGGRWLISGESSTFVPGYEP